MTNLEELEGMRILLVDDDKLIRNSLSLYFNSYGDTTLMSMGSAEEALADLQIHSYDILVVDYKLPGLSGLELLKRIQKSHQKLIKIFITAFGSEEIFKQARDLGASDTIEKPLSIEKLENSIAGLLQPERF